MTEDAIPEPDRVDGAPHPRETASLYGQAAAEADFLDVWRAGRLHHAWLLTGPRGVGKATLAWRIARALIGQAPGGMFGAPEIPASLDIARDTPIFRRLASLGEPRLKLLRRPWDEKAKRLKTAITVEEARSLKSFFNMSAADGGWRVAIVDSVDEMNQAAANALLKILEEPPEKSILLLVSHTPSKLLPTVRSRCRVLPLQPLSPENLSAAVADATGAPPDPAIAALAGGSAGEALRLNAVDGAKTYAELVTLISGAPGLDRPALHRLADSAAGREAEARYDSAVRLAALLLARLARAAAIGPGPEAAPGEAALMARLAANPAQARIWAEAMAAFESRTARARAVNLDPSLTILDTFLAIDAAAGRALACA
jgi:DNA polymerase-3 subunit delta'